MFLIAHWRMFAPAAAIVAIVSQVGPAAGSADGAGRSGAAIHHAERAWRFPHCPARHDLRACSTPPPSCARPSATRSLAASALTFGADEVRLLGVAGAMACLFVPIVSLVLFVLSRSPSSARSRHRKPRSKRMLADPDAMNEAIVAAAGRGWGGRSVALYHRSMFVIFMILAARLYMVNAATIGERRMVIFQTWSWSSRNILRLLGAMILTVLPVMLIDSVVDSVGVSLLLALPGQSCSPPPSPPSGPDR
jgi:hypothetical protein